MIDKTTPIPLYYQIMEDIKKQIKNGELNPGDKLPNEGWLIQYYDVSRVTIRKALSELNLAGVLVSKKGKGNYVSSPRVELSLAQISSLYRALADKGITPSSRIVSVSYDKVNSELAKLMNLEVGEKIITVKRVRLADGNPICMQTLRLVEKLCPSLDPSRLDNRSLYEMLENDCNIKIGHSYQEIDVVNPSINEITALELTQRSPLLCISVQLYNTDNQLIEYSISHYVSERYKYSVVVYYNK